MNIRTIAFRTTVIAVATAALAIAAPAAFAGQTNLTGLQPGQTYDGFIVRYREGTPERTDVTHARAAVSRAVPARLVGGQRLSLGHQRRLAVGADLVRTSRRLDRVEAERLMRQIAADPNVEYVEPDIMLQASYSPNDTYYASEQWHYFENAGGIRADKAWDVSTGSGVVVAVLDTGITNHSDLNANIVAGYDFVSDPGNAGDGNGRDSNPADPGDYANAGFCYSGSPAHGSSWHGTHVAGTIAAVTNNARGVAGVAFNAKVQPVRVLGKCGGSLSDISDAIVWAAGGSVAGVPANPTPAKVINMSLGGGGSCSATYQNAINSAVNRGTTVVVAAGNENDNTGYYQPSSCANVVNVASTTRQGGRSSFSNYGNQVDVAAPGSNIASTVNTGNTTPSSEGYSYMSGTSMAAPHVAGVVALMQSKAGNSLTPAQVESVLKSTLRPFPVGIDRAIGNGIVDARAAVDAVSGGGGNPNPPGGGSLTRGVPVTGLSASTGAWLEFTLDVPSGASNLSFSMSGGSGDADMYVKYGSAPTQSSYDCRPYRSGNVENCTFASPNAGRYYVRLRAYSGFSGVSLVGDFATGGGGGGSVQTYTNGTDYAIRDLYVVESPITVSGRSGYGQSSTRVDVDIRHSYRGDLRVQLVAPDGTTYLIKDYNGSDSADNVIGYALLNLSNKTLNGTWKLRVSDNWRGDTGYINSWSIRF